MNTPEKRETIEDVLGEFGFRLVWSVQDHWADVKAFEIVGRNEDGNPLFDSDDSPNRTMTTEDAREYLEGFVKWDGCTELDQGSPHWCGPYEYRKHFALLRYIYHRAYELMGCEPDEPWEPATAVTLEPDYDAALIGNTVHPEHASRAVYSLNTLARIRSRQGNRSIEAAQEDVKGMVMSVIEQHGDRAPLFVDDVVRLAPPKKQKSRLILPGMARFNTGNA